MLTNKTPQVMSATSMARWWLRSCREDRSLRPRRARRIGWWWPDAHLASHPEAQIQVRCRSRVGGLDRYPSSVAMAPVGRHLEVHFPGGTPVRCHVSRREGKLVRISQVAAPSVWIARPSQKRIQFFWAITELLREL